MGGSPGEVSQALNLIKERGPSKDRFDPSAYSEGVGSVFNQPSATAANPSDFSFTGGNSPGYRSRRDVVWSGHEGDASDFEFDQQLKGDAEFNQTRTDRASLLSPIETQMMRAANYLRDDAALIGTPNTRRDRWQTDNIDYSRDYWKSSYGEYDDPARNVHESVPYRYRGSSPRGPFPLESLGYVAPESGSESGSDSGSDSGFDFRHQGNYDQHSPGSADAYRWLSENQPVLFERMVLDAGKANARTANDPSPWLIPGKEAQLAAGERIRNEWLNPSADSGGFQFRGHNPIQNTGGLGSFEFDRITDTGGPTLRGSSQSNLTRGSAGGGRRYGPRYSGPERPHFKGDPPRRRTDDGKFWYVANPLNRWDFGSNPVLGGRGEATLSGRERQQASRGGLINYGR